MWKLLIAAAVSGFSGFAAKYFLSPGNRVPEETRQCNGNNEDGTFNESGFKTNSETQDRIFAFSKDSRKNPVIGRRGSKNGIRIAKFGLRSVVEVRSKHWKGRKALSFGLKRRKTTKNIAGKAGFCSSKDSLLFGLGVGFGILYMMTAKAEISELNKIMDEIARVVEELKSELNRRKSSCAHQNFYSFGKTDMQSRKMSGRHDEVMLKKISSEFTDNDVKFWSLPVNNEGQYGSSVLTEEPDQRVLEMDQLEAELEFELQKLSGSTIDSPCHEEIREKLDELEVPDEGCPGNGTDDRNFNSFQSQGIWASELNQKLSQLLIKQQENQIAELESELYLAQSNLHAKEAELHALKDRVRRLTVSTVSDDDAEAIICRESQSNRLLW